MEQKKSICISLASHHALVFGLKATERFIQEGIRVSLVVTEASLFAFHNEFDLALPVENPEVAKAALVEFLELSKLEAGSLEVILDDAPYSAAARLDTFDALVLAPASVYTVSSILSVSDKTATAFIGNELLSHNKPLYALISETSLSAVSLELLTKAANAGIMIDTCVPAFDSSFGSVDELINNTVFAFVDRVLA